jgi:hypothetical protein
MKAGHKAGEGQRREGWGNKNRATIVAMTRWAAKDLIQRGASQHRLEVEWLEAIAVSFEEFALELDPMEAQGVEEALQEIHAQKHSEGDACEDSIARVDHDRVAGVDHAQQSLLPKHSRKLRVGKRESPKTEIGGCVGHLAEG